MAERQGHASGTQVADTEGVLARKRRINELARRAASRSTAHVGEAEAAVAEAEEALAAAQQDALELSQRIAALTGEHDSLREEVGRLEQPLTDARRRDARAWTSASPRSASATAKDRPDRDHARRSASPTARPSSSGSRKTPAGRARAARRPLPRESAISERLSTCQVEIATVSEREVHLKRQVTSITSELAELETTRRASRETEEALELLRERIQPVHDLYIVLQERAEHWAREAPRPRALRAGRLRVAARDHPRRAGRRADVQAEIDDAERAR